MSFDDRISIGEGARVLDDFQPEIRHSSSRIVIGEGCKVRGKWALLGKDQTLVFGAGTIINGFPVGILAEDGDELHFGDGCLLASPMFRTSDGHPVYSVATGKRINPSAPIRIGPRNWIGDRAIVLKGVETGADTVIGAGALVTGMKGGYPPNSALNGCPAVITATGIRWEHHF